MSDEAGSAQLVPLRWWHLRAVMGLEQALFGAEKWSEESFWSELVFCPPMLIDGPFRRYWAAIARPVAQPVARADGRGGGAGDGGGVLGYAGVAVGDDESYVQTIGVAPAAQRRGIGSLLLRRLLDDASAVGARICWLEVRADNAGAQAMYEGFGFRARGRRRGYYQPSGVDAIVMAAELPVVGEQAAGVRR